MTHLAERTDLPGPYTARASQGSEDHAAMVRVLRTRREHAGLDEMPTVEQLDLTYANLRDCDPATDVAIVESTAAGADAEVALFTEMVVVHRDGRRQRGPHAVPGGERRPHSVPIVCGSPRTRP